MIRKYRPSDLKTLRQITAICFEGASIDKNIEDKFGIINELDWKQRKMPHIDNDVEVNADGVFVAEIDGEVTGILLPTSITGRKSVASQTYLCTQTSNSGGSGDN